MIGNRLFFIALGMSLLSPILVVIASHLDVESPLKIDLLMFSGSMSVLSAFLARASGRREL